MTSLAAHVAQAVTRLTEAGLSEADARSDASLLARSVLGWDAALWLTRQRDAAPSDFPAAFNATISRRAAREPFAYITGTREFYGRAFTVTPDVLIPRPETEGLIDAALEHLRTTSATTRQSMNQQGTEHRSTPHTSTHHSVRGCPVLVLDVGTGSGCLAVTLALEVPAARLVATDTSAAALDVARANAARLGTGDRVTFVQCSWLAGLTGPFDVIVSNPPYVPDGLRASLAPEVATWEPHGALFAGADGLDAYRAIAPLAARALAPDGALVCEIGEGHADAVRAILAVSDLRVDAVRPDLQGILRVIVARRASAL
jgi:release factor glutamine methyltransferase